jgi:hypothetical protein
MGHVNEFVSKMLAKSLAGGGKTGRGLPLLLLLSRANQGYNVVVVSLGKETASPIRRDCRARATHPSAVKSYTSKIFGTCQIVKRPRKSLTWNV